jgi:peptidyl-dipeptidase A
VDAPVAHSEQDFEPGAKYHAPANVPYTRYFVAHVLQFPFHRVPSQAAGCKEPLNRRSIHWPEAPEAMTGQRTIDATAIRDYFAPLPKWLGEQNKGKPAGW